MNQALKLKPVQIVNSILNESQIDDVHDTLNRFYVQNKKGKLFTNATGTGKTYLACGVVDAINAICKPNVLIVAPTDALLADWKKSFLSHGYPSKVITCSGSAAVGEITLITYASFRQSVHLLSITYDLVVVDESHHLMMNTGGDKTTGSDLMRALVGHPKGLYLRHGFTGADTDEARAVNVELHARAFEKTKVLLLSATPFATHKCIDYAEGLIFDYGEEPTSIGYNTPSAKDRFFIDHFGYSIRCGKLQRPDVAVDIGLMERNFHEFLVASGGLSFRSLVVDTDYSRDFILIDSAIGAKIDAGLKVLREGNYPWLKSIGAGCINSQKQKQLLESIKARAAIDRIRKHLALGRKVVVYHSFHQEEICQPFQFDSDIEKISDCFDRDRAEREYERFKAENPELASIEGLSLQSTVSTFEAAFGDSLGVVNGRVSKTKRNKYIKLFNQDDSGVNVILLQERAGREGLSFQDKSGKHQRVLMQLGMPADAVACIQIEGRIRRYLSASNAIYEYFNTGTFFEVSSFARAIAERSETVENMACGANARNLKASFISGYLNSGSDEPSEEQGTGGVESDCRSVETDVWNQARSKYYGKMKKNSRTKSAEGSDFYATPEPIGLFMVMLARLRAGQSFLEPSTGTGSIAAWCPHNVNLTCVENSYELFERLQLLINRRATFKHMSFENFYYGRGFDGTVMNPPFGTGGKLAAEHLKKACELTRGTGRVVALIPDTENMDKRVEKMLRELEKDKCYMRMIGSYSLPTLTFERAGTSVKTKILVFIRSTDRFSRLMEIQCKYEDFSFCDTHDELFSAIKDYADCNLQNQNVTFGAPISAEAPTINLDLLPVQILQGVKSNIVEGNFLSKVPSECSEKKFERLLDKQNQLQLFG